MATGKGTMHLNHMGKASESDKSLVDNLRDAGCEPEMVVRFLQLYEDGKTKELLGLLAEQRKGLLAAIHQEQARLDCLDYLIHQTKQQLPQAARRSL